MADHPFECFSASYPKGWTREQKIAAYAAVKGTAKDVAVKLQVHMKRDHPGIKLGVIGGWNWAHMVAHGEVKA